MRSSLLRDHPVVAFDGHLGEVVGVELDQAAAPAVAVAAHCSPAGLDPVCCERRAEAFEARRGAVEVGKVAEAALRNAAAGTGVEAGHGLPGVV